MPAFLYAMLVALAPLLSSLVFKLLVSLGIGIATYTGFNAVISSIATQMASMWSGLGADLMAMAYLMQIDRSINLLLSAYTVRLTLQGLTALGSISRFRVS